MSKRRPVLGIDQPLDPKTIPATPGSPATTGTPPPTRVGVGSPTVVGVVAGLERTDQGQTGYIDIDWDGPSHESVPGYVVQLARNTSYTLDLATRTVSGATNWREPNLKQGDSWYYRVFAVVGSTWSEGVTGGPVTVPIDTAPPLPPTSLSIVFQASGSVSISASMQNDGRSRRVKFVIQPQLANGANNGSSRTITVESGRFEYSLGMNKSDSTSGIPSPRIEVTSSVESWSGVLSTTVVASVMSSAPSTAPTILIAGGAVSGFGVSLSGTLPDNFSHYKIRITQNGVAYQSLTTTASIFLVQATLAATYRVYARFVDILGQEGPEGDSGNFTLDLMGIERLRELARYKDNINSNSTSLGYLKDRDLTTAGQSIVYPKTTTGGPWNWTEFERPSDDLYGAICASLTPTNDTKWYIAASTDGVTWTRFFSGLVGGTTFATYTVESNAQLAALPGIYPNNAKKSIRLPLLSTGYPEYRFWRLYHRNDVVGYRVYEFYPRRVVESDDIITESLAALSATLGDVSVGSLTGVLITGSTLQTATSGPRVVISTAGVDSYATGVGEWSQSGYRFKKTDGTVYGLLTGSSDEFAETMYLGFWTTRSGSQKCNLAFIDDGIVQSLTIEAPNIFLSGHVSQVSGGFNLGSAFGAANGQFRSSGQIAAGGNPIGNGMIETRSATSTNSSSALTARNSGGSTILTVFGNGSATLAGTLTQNSDLRLKNLSENFQVDWEKLMRVRFLWYTWKEDQEKQQHVGVIAQEIHRLFPELVTEDPETGLLSVDYIGLGLYFDRLVQLVAKKVKILERRLDRLERKLL